MNGPLIHMRVLRPDGTEVCRGPLRPDVTADALKIEGEIWHILERRGYRIEPCGAVE